MGAPWLIGLSGYARTGKDTIASILVEDYGFVRVAFADLVRDSLVALNPDVRNQDGEHFPLAEMVRWYGWEKLKLYAPDVRGLLQRMGTEVGRNILGENVWVDATFKSLYPDERYVISDVRFENEAKAVTRNRGVLARVSRMGFGPANDHSSEVALDRWPFDVQIRNNGEIGDLREIVADALMLER